MKHLLALIKNNAFFLLLLISFLCSYFIYENWKISAIKGGDNWGYYSYLPSFFIYGDLKNLDKTYEARNRVMGTDANPAGIKNRIGEAPDALNGNRVIKYTMGVALLQAPFFLVTHLYQKLTGNSAEGFEFPYIFSVFISILLYTFIGLFLLKKVLENWFSNHVVFLVLLSIFFGTNIYYFTTFNIGMSHPYLFFLYCLLLYATVFFFKKPGWKTALAIGFSVGMTALIRPTAILCAFIPLFYGIDVLKNKPAIFNFCKTYYKEVLLAVVTIILIPIPQFYYWKQTAGSWLYDSYPGEHFNFLQPHIKDGMFGWKNGWLSYTPVMLLIFPGIYFMWKQKHPLRIAISIILPLHIYIIYSWWCWQYINGYGSRAMIELYPLLAIPLAVSYKVFLKHKLSAIPLYCFLLLCIAHNVFQTMQIEHGRYYSDDATGSFFWRRFFKWKYDYNDLVAYDNDEKQPAQKNLIRIRALAKEDFENTKGLMLDSAIKKSGNFSAILIPGKEYNGGVEVALPASTALPGDYIKISAWCYTNTNQGVNGMGKLVADLKQDGETFKWLSIRIENKIKPVKEGYTFWWGEQGNWERVYFFVQLPYRLNGTETIRCYPWNPSVANFRIDDLTVELWRRIK